jgi:hypothetical protein
MNDAFQESQQVAAPPTPAVRSLWLNLSNVCERGSFKVSLDIDGVEKVLFLQNVEQDEGVVSHSFNLTQYLRASQDEIVRLKRRNEDLWIGLVQIKNAGTDDPKKLKEMAASWAEENSP